MEEEKEEVKNNSNTTIMIMGIIIGVLIFIICIGAVKMFSNTEKKDTSTPNNQEEDKNDKKDDTKDDTLEVTDDMVNDLYKYYFGVDKYTDTKTYLLDGDGLNASWAYENLLYTESKNVLYDLYDNKTKLSYLAEYKIDMYGKSDGYKDSIEGCTYGGYSSTYTIEGFEKEFKKFFGQDKSFSFESFDNYLLGECKANGDNVECLKCGGAGGTRGPGSHLNIVGTKYEVDGKNIIVYQDYVKVDDETEEELSEHRTYKLVFKNNGDNTFFYESIEPVIDSTKCNGMKSAKYLISEESDNNYGNVNFTLKEDGTYTWMIPNSDGADKGTYTIYNGKLSLQSNTPFCDATWLSCDIQTGVYDITDDCSTIDMNNYKLIKQ